jgi:FMN phosphatase YigB (HAD superfamily)
MWRLSLAARSSPLRIGPISMKLVIFDFDGTLVDSRKLIIESHRIIFNEYGFSPPTVFP